METKTHNEQLGNNIFLTGIMLFANLDFAGLADYAIKALIGGAVWFGYKWAADYLTRKKKSS